MTGSLAEEFGTRDSREEPGAASRAPAEPPESRAQFGGGPIGPGEREPAALATSWLPEGFVTEPGPRALCQHVKCSTESYRDRNSLMAWPKDWYHRELTGS